MKRIMALLLMAVLAAGCSRDEQTAPNGVANDADPPSAPQATAAKESPPVAPKPSPAASPCLVQDGRPLRIARLKAVGTEPFWAARIEGRCVTYSHPEDQAGTRVWTRFTPHPGGGSWVGALGGSSFELRTHAAPGCSDGMSDKRYPIAVTLAVNGEERTGCAEPDEKG